MVGIQPPAVILRQMRVWTTSPTARSTLAREGSVSNADGNMMYDANETNIDTRKDVKQKRARAWKASNELEIAWTLEIAQWQSALLCKQEAVGSNPAFRRKRVFTCRHINNSWCDPSSCWKGRRK